MQLPANNILVSLSDISVSYDGMPVLQHCSIDVAKDDFVVVTGPNGGGKTTLLRIVNNILIADEGEVEVLGHPVSMDHTSPLVGYMPEERGLYDAGTVCYCNDGVEVEHLNIGYLPQKNAIDSRFPISVGEVIMSGLYDKKSHLSKREQQERLKAILKDLGLEQLECRPIGELSGGQLQRVLLGRAVVARPQLLVLDEPLSYIDGEWCERIYDMLARWKNDMAIVMVTHYPERVAGLATKSLHIERGVL